MIPIRPSFKKPRPRSAYKGLKNLEKQIENAQNKLPKGGTVSRDWAARPQERTAPIPVSTRDYAK